MCHCIAFLFALRTTRSRVSTSIMSLHISVYSRRKNVTEKKKVLYSYKNCSS